MKKIEIKFMDIEQYDEFLDYTASLKDTCGEDMGRTGNKIGIWIMKNVYPEVSLKGITPGTVAMITRKTMELTQKVEEDDIKNLGEPLSGELQEGQNTVKLAEKPTNSRAKK